MRRRRSARAEQGDGMCVGLRDGDAEPLDTRVHLSSISGLVAFAAREAAPSRGTRVPFSLHGRIHT